MNLLWGTLRRVLYCITYYVLIAVSCRIRRSLSTLQRRIRVSHYGPANPESLVSLQDLYGALDNDGAAENMTFYGGGPESAVKSDGSRVVRQKKCFRGPNGLFFTLFVLRTTTPITVASTLFRRGETTGGRAFTTWLNFLARSLRHFVLLPLPHEVPPPHQTTL